MCTSSLLPLRRLALIVVVLGILLAIAIILWPLQVAGEPQVPEALDKVGAYCTDDWCFIRRDTLQAVVADVSLKLCGWIK